jgi:hypothetical protein
MAQCSICSHERAKEINLWLLRGRQMTAVVAEFGIKKDILRYHRQKHLPWRKHNTPKATTTEGKLAELEFEFARLRALAEAGEKIDGSLRVLVAQRSLLELMLRREGLLDATHRALIPQPVDGDYAVVFEGGRPRTVKKAVNE